MLRTNSQTANPFVSLPTQAWADRLVARITDVTQTFTRWQARSRGRRKIAMLDAHLLRDIGLTRDDIRRESTKPFWRA